LFIQTGSTRWYAPYNLTLKSITPRLATPASGSNVIATINKNLSAVLVVNFPVNTYTMTPYISAIPMATGDFITVDINQIGSFTAGSNLYITFVHTTGVP